MELEKLLLETPPRQWVTRQAIVLDWSDGPRYGLCALEMPRSEFLFRFAGERRQEDDLDDRFFRLDELPAGSVDEAVSMLSVLGSPGSNVWVPVWKWRDASARGKAEARLQELEHGGRPTDLVICTRDMKTFLGLWTIDAAIPADGDLSALISRLPQMQ